MISSIFSLERISATITWMIVSGFSLWMMWNSDYFDYTDLGIMVGLCAVYFVLWVYITESEDPKRPVWKRQVAAICLFFVIIGIYFSTPVTFVAIFMVIFSAITPYFMSLKRAFLVSPILASPLFFVYSFYWGQSGVVVNTFLFWTFNIFALVMVSTSLREKEARLQAELSTRELKSTQVLLNEAVKQGERVRIARNIHDLLGHHLTALTINLQVASRKSEGEVKDSIDQCHQLAKLLLSDVREAVSDIRDKSKLDLDASIRSMLEKLPNLSLTLDIDEQIQIDDIQVADTIIKAVQETITNTLKHAHGSNISLKISYTNPEPSENKQLQIDISNDGKMPVALALGHGLMGITERVKALAGSASFIADTKHFRTRLLIPVVQND
jgi:signal transduction histidine kinase